MTEASERPSTAAEEAAQLFEALRVWVESRGGSTVPIATGSQECRACPVCITLAALRNQHPQVAEYVDSAAEAILAVVRTLLASHDDAWTNRHRGNVERIDIE